LLDWIAGLPRDHGVHTMNSQHLLAVSKQHVKEDSKATSLGFKHWCQGKSHTS